MGFRFHCDDPSVAICATAETHRRPCRRSSSFNAARSARTGSTPTSGWRCTMKIGRSVIMIMLPRPFPSTVQPPLRLHHLGGGFGADFRSGKPNVVNEGIDLVRIFFKEAGEQHHKPAVGFG